MGSDGKHRIESTKTSRSGRWQGRRVQVKGADSGWWRRSDEPDLGRYRSRLRVGVRVDGAELLNLKTRKKISISIGRARDVMEKNMDVAGCGTKEEGTDETHDRADPGAMGPDGNESLIVGVDDDRGYEDGRTRKRRRRGRRRVPRM